MVCYRKLMDSNGFLTALREFPTTLARDSVEALVDLQNGVMAKAIDRIAHKVSFHNVGPSYLPGSW